MSKTFSELLLTNIKVIRGKWLGRPVNIKEANNQAMFYVENSLDSAHLFLSSLTMHELHNRNASIGWLYERITISLINYADVSRTDLSC